jgi:hypothetical protein
MVSEDGATPRRDEVLEIIDSEDTTPAKWTKIRALNVGAVYRYMVVNHLSKLRGGAACMIYYKEEPEKILITDTVRLHTHSVDTVYVERVVEKIVEKEVVVEVDRTPAEEPASRKPYYWAVKSNMLYDLMLIPDLALEFSIGRRFSIEANGQMSWWGNKKLTKAAWRLQSGGIEFRYWLGDRSKRTPLSGHTLGLYGLYADYDFRLGANNTGYVSRDSFSVGLSYAYALPVARSWSIEFGLSAGYLGGEYKTYSEHDASRSGNLRDGTYKMRYFGPTKLRISISWLPGGKNNIPPKEKKKK